MSSTARKRSQGRRTPPFWRKKKPPTNTAAVGTEAAALANLQENARNFNYPDAGFVHKIEYSLLYAMISEPDVYPDSVVRQEIEQEDFTTYLEVAAENTAGDEPLTSYAQLSAILALSAEKLPAEAQNAEDSSDAWVERDRTDKTPSLPETLCKTILKTVVQYAEEYDLDRAAEVQELMGPVERYSVNRIETTELKGIVPIYVGYAASILTGNPLPLLIGASVTMTQTGDTAEQRKTVSSLQSETQRKGNVETTSLLDEAED